MSSLQIGDARERLLVGAADVALELASALRRSVRRPVKPTAPKRILLLRLERIGDLLMVLPAIRDVRELAPLSDIDLIVGSWNASLANAVPFVTRVDTLDASWLAREGDGGSVQSGPTPAGPGPAALGGLLRAARGWRPRRYDLAINFEPDIRSNLIMAASGAGWTAGWSSGGGGPLLDAALDYDPRLHTTVNARTLISAVFERQAPDSARPLLAIPDAAVRAAVARLPVGRSGPIVGIHTSGGRAIKQWEPERFADVARRLADDRRATIVLTGGRADRALVDHVKSALAPRPVVDAAGDLDLLVLAGLLERFDLLVTGDTGPMHLAAVMGTPVVAVFGPSDPARYAPAGPFDRVVRVDLPCSPCNRIRLPPARCVGHTPDCLVHVSADQVYSASIATLDAAASRAPRAGRA
jgi:ADP-heptose:LPS heptosyltransferase